MLHSFTKIILHVVWATKEREKLLTKQVRPKITSHIVEYSKQNDILLDSINIQLDHVHLLLYLRSNQQIDQIVKLIKGESSHWMNTNNLIPDKFSWQRGYGAFSVSPSHVETIRKYIASQDEHHKIKTYMEEYNSILKKYGFTALSETDESV